MNADSLWSSILQAAIQGKLVPQDSNDGTASSLFDVSCILKVEDYPSFDIPFSIPENWSYVFLGCITDFRGNASVLSEIIPDDAYVLELDNIEKNTGRIIGTTNPRKLNKGSNQHIFKKGCVLYSKLRPYLNKVVIPDRDGYCSTEIIPLYFANGIDLQYIQIVLMSRYFVDFTMDNVYGAKMPRFNLKKGAEFLVPVPPLAEQKRIVAKLQELKPLVERYGWYQTRLSELNASIGPLLKKSILQAAIQGKLVPQDLIEDSASLLLQKIIEEKQKLLKGKLLKRDKCESQITIENGKWVEIVFGKTSVLEVPFEIPESWTWARLKTVCLKITDGTHHSPPNSVKGDYMYISAKNIKDSGIDLSNLTYVSESIHKEIYSRCDPVKGDILFIKDGATTGVVTINNLDEQFSLLSSVALIRPSCHIDRDYVVRAIRSPYFFNTVRNKMSGGAITRVTLDKIEQFLLPVPPLAEQHRIVSKLDELFKIIDKKEVKSLRKG